MNDEYLSRLVAKGLVEEVSKHLNESIKLQRELLKRENRIGEIRQKDLLKEFGLSSETLREWERQGLKRIQRGRSAFYNLEDLHNFYY